MAQRRISPFLSFALLLSAFGVLPVMKAQAYHAPQTLINGDEDVSQKSAATALDHINQGPHSSAFAADYLSMAAATNNRPTSLQSLESLMPTTSIAAVGAVSAATTAKETSLMDHLRDLRRSLSGSASSFSSSFQSETALLTRDPAMVARESVRVGRMYDPKLYASADSDSTKQNPSALYPGQPLGGSTKSLLRPVGAVRMAQAGNTAVPLGHHYAMADTPPFSGSTTNLSAKGTTMASPADNVAETSADMDISFPSFSMASANTDTQQAPVITGNAPKAPVYGAVAIPLSSGSAINVDRRWGVFATTSAMFGKQEILKRSAAADTSGAGVTAGIDYKVARDSFVGIAFSYAHDSFNIQNQSDLDGDSYSLSLFGTTSYLTNGYVDGYISAGYHDFDSERNVLIGTNTMRLATGSPDGVSVSGRAETGYDFDENGWKYGPFAGVSLLYTDFGSWTESGAGALGLRVDDLSSFNMVGNVGVNAAKRFSMDDKGSITPSLRMAYNHRVGSDHTSVNAAFIENGSYVFRTQSSATGQDWVSFAPAVTATLPNDWMLQLSYLHDFFRQDQSQNLFNIAARYRW